MDRKNAAVQEELAKGAAHKSTLTWALAAVVLAVAALAAFAWHKYKYLTKRHFL